MWCLHQTKISFTLHLIGWLKAIMRHPPPYHLVTNTQSELVRPASNLQPIACSTSNPLPFPTYHIISITHQLLLIKAWWAPKMGVGQLDILAAYISFVRRDCTDFINAIPPGSPIKATHITDQHNAYICCQYIQTESLNPVSNVQ